MAPRKQRETPIIHIENAGRGFWEQIQVDGKELYVFYNPSNELMKNENIEYDHYHPSGETTDDGSIIHYVPMKKCPWPRAGEPQEPDQDLWDIIKAYIISHVELPDDRLYDVVAAYIYATWIPETFNVVPYFHIIGPKGSGKTRLGEVLQQLCYRGMMSSNISEAALFRSAEAFHPTLLLDEAEIYNEKDRGSIQNLMNSGYRRGSPAIRIGGMEQGNPKLELFDVFGFKALIGTGGYKGTLESRSIRVSMEKNIRKVAFNLDYVQAKEIRSQLLLWRFRRLADMASVGSVGSERYLEGVPNGLEFADGRFAELYSPLIFVANHGKEAILSYAKEAYHYMIEEEGTSIEAEIVETLINCYEFVNSGWIATRTITNSFNEDKPVNEQWKSNSVGRYMKKLGFKPSRRNTGAGWIYDRKRLERLAERYTIPLPEPTLHTLHSPIKEAS